MKFFSHLYHDELKSLFFKEPQFFTKHSSRKLLSYALGATLYMPATRPNIHQDIISKKHEGLTSIVIDLEDAVGDNELRTAEAGLILELLKLSAEVVDSYFFSLDDLPLLFIRTRSHKQFKFIKDHLGEAIRLLTGVVIPKFSVQFGREMLEEVRQIHTEEHPFYAMPILETARVIHKETRMGELLNIKELIDQYQDYILNIRIGATDFSGLYGIRRSVDMTVYDIAILRDCIADIINVFQRQEHPYVISGPVWEYFSAKTRMVKQTPYLDRFGNNEMKWRGELSSRHLDGLIREILMDIANGLTGKTVIHPSHIKIVQALNVISYEEYCDACRIIEAANGDIGVLKSDFANKMNEIKPHYFWAEKILLKSQLYGVLHAEITNIDLIKKEVYV